MNRQLFLLLIVIFVGGFTHPAGAVDVHFAPEITAALEGIRLVEDPTCGTGRVRVEEFYRVTGADPVELLLERDDKRLGENYQTIRFVDRAGRVVNERCVARDRAESGQVRFLGVRGGASGWMAVAFDPAAGNRFDALPEERIPLYRATRHRQFADKKNPERGTCCWHYVYITYPWHSVEPFSEINLPMTIEPFPASSGGHLYFQLHTALNEIPFYFGFQTQLRLHDKELGPGVIFSRWESQDPGDLESVPGGFSEIGAYEGRFVSVRKPMELGEGPMTLRLRVRPDRSSGAYLWLELSIRKTISENREGEELVGALRFPGQQARLSKRLKMTVESYDLRKLDLASTWLVPCFVWTIAAPSIDGRLLRVEPDILYPEGVPRLVKAVRQDANGVRVQRIGWTLIDSDGQACTVLDHARRSKR
ncbi:MAG: hypothetical protein H7834_01270 [Magnetococcus sp. YQC-9]